MQNRNVGMTCLDYVEFTSHTGTHVKTSRNPLFYRNKSTHGQISSSKNTNTCNFLTFKVQVDVVLLRRAAGGGVVPGQEAQQFAHFLQLRSRFYLVGSASQIRLSRHRSVWQPPLTSCNLRHKISFELSAMSNIRRPEITHGRGTTKR
jgi:hypothetical protein